MSFNSFAIAKWATAKLKMKMLQEDAAGSFLLLRISDLVVDAVDVADVSVSEIVSFPPREHLAFSGIGSRSEKVESSDASSNALQNTDKEQWRNPLEMLGNARQNTIVLLMPTKARDEDCKRDEFDDSLQSCSQIYSDASSGKKFQMQRQQWRKNGKNCGKSRHGCWRRNLSQ